jgi:hypothetical protein
MRIGTFQEEANETNCYPGNRSAVLQRCSYPSAQFLGQGDTGKEGCKIHYRRIVSEANFDTWGGGQWEYGKLSYTTYSNDSVPNGGRPDTTAVRVTSILGPLSPCACFYCIGHRVQLVMREPTACLDYQRLATYVMTFRDLITLRHLSHFGQRPVLQFIKTAKDLQVDAKVRLPQ